MSALAQVLVVDDDPVARAALGGLLKRRYEVTTAATAEEALRLFAGAEFDVVLADVLLPDLNGCALTERLRAMPRGAQVPIVMISASSDEALVLDALSRGADDFLVKPVSLEKLLQQVERHLVQRRTEGSKRRALDPERYDLARDTVLAQRTLQRILHTYRSETPAIRAYLAGFSLFDGDLFLSASVERRTRWMLADVAGHGLRAALGALPLALLFGQSVRAKQPLVASVATISEEMQHLLPVGLFAAAVFVDHDPESGRLSVWNGAMPAIRVRRARTGQIEHVTSGNVPLGVCDPHAPSLCELEVERGDLVLASSDGVTECANSQGEQFGDRELDAALGRPSADPSLVLKRVLTALETFARGSMSDDVSIVAHVIG